MAALFSDGALRLADFLRVAAEIAKIEAVVVDVVALPVTLLPQPFAGIASLAAIVVTSFGGTGLNREAGERAAEQSGQRTERLPAIDKAVHLCLRDTPIATRRARVVAGGA
jgi:hypothetical protein